MTKNNILTTVASVFVIASASTLFVFNQSKNTDNESNTKKIDSKAILEEYDRLKLPEEIVLEVRAKKSQEEVSEKNKVREAERDKVHEQKLKEEAERKRLIAQREEAERKKHEENTKNYAIISRGQDSQQIVQQAQQYKQQQQQQIAQQSQGTNLGTFQITGYGADCVGCSGITAAGINVRGGVTHYQGYRVIATDPNVIPMFSIVHIEGVGNCIAVDTGGAIKGNIIDLLFPSEAHTHAWGRQHRNVSIIRYGG